MERRNLVRMLGGLLWIAAPALALMLFLPHEAELNRKMTLLFLLLIMLVNSLALLLPAVEREPGGWPRACGALYAVALIGLTCAAIAFSGGMRSPLFALLLLATAFSSGLFASLRSAALLACASTAAYLATALAHGGVGGDDAQSLCMQAFCILLTSFFIHRMGVESREQAREHAAAMQELRRLSQMDRAASSFVSAVSFEMRTPLTSILGFGDLLASAQLEPEKEREYIDIISREADNLSRLVADLLDISRLESGRLRLNRELTSLTHLLEMSLPALGEARDPALLSPQAPPDLLQAMVDPQRMKRVFDSIFGYVKRSSGPDAELRASAKAEGDEVVITLNIRERGAASAALARGRIFPPLGAPDKDDLELAMARRIVTAHGGSINLIETSGEWFTIVLRIPREEEHDSIAPLAPGLPEEGPA